jgi:hypothetical protein
MVVASSKTDVNEMKPIQTGVRTLTGLMPLTMYRFIFKAFLANGQPEYTWIKEGSTDAPIDEFNLPAWVSSQAIPCIMLLARFRLEFFFFL